MSVETDLVTAITGDATIGGLIDDRLDPILLAADRDLPAMSYQVISQVVQGGICYRARVQLSLHDSSYTGLKALRDGVKSLTETKLNWQYNENADAYADDEGVYRQTVDLIIT